MRTDDFKSDKGIPVKIVATIGNWNILEGRLGRETRWTAVSSRPVPPPQNGQLGKDKIYTTECTLSSIHEMMAVYGYTSEKKTGKRSKGFLKPDPLPLRIVAELLRFKNSHIDIIGG